MRFTILLSMLFLALPSLKAQDSETNVVLEEVVVNAAKVIKKVDGQWLYPTNETKKSSNTGYQLLSRLNLPNIHVDPVRQTISAMDGRGYVQLRMNGILTSREELLALDPNDVTRIEFIDTPGVRYGEEVSSVINVITRRFDSGYTTGINAYKSLTTNWGNGNAFVKWNKGKNEWSANYGLGGAELDGSRIMEKTDYTLTDGTIRTLERNTMRSHFRSHSHNFKLMFNRADSTHRVFQAAVSGNLSRKPESASTIDIHDGTSSTTAESRTSADNDVFTGDLYWFSQLARGQSITLTNTFTFLHTKSTNRYDEGGLYQYNVSGKSLSTMGEGIYEHKGRRLTFSAGVNYFYKDTHSDYQGDVEAVNRMCNFRIGGFADVRGKWHELGYVVGVGAKLITYKQDHYDYQFVAWRPKLSLTYQLSNPIQIRYNADIKEHVSQVAMMNDVLIRTNSLEWKKGNPDIHPNAVFSHSLNVSYSNDRLYAFISGEHLYHHRPNMAAYERTDDNRFIYSQRNMKSISVLQVMGYLNYWIVPKKVNGMIYGGVFRCFNYGEDYRHFYTNYPINAALTAYLGPFTLSATAERGWRWLEGETRGRNGDTYALSAQYSVGNWTFGATWEQAFINKYLSHEAELLNRNLHKLTRVYDYDSGNEFSISVSWKINRGKKYQNVNRSLYLKDTDTGVM